MEYRDWTIRTSSEEETIAAGVGLATRLRGVVLLSGDLGAGKTTLVRGIVAGVTGTLADEVSSPTFTLIHDYGAGVTHIDLYRLDDPRQIDTLGLDEVFDQSTLVLIEWGEKLGLAMPNRRTEIRIEHLTLEQSVSDNERLIRIVERGD